MRQVAAAFIALWTGSAWAQTISVGGAVEALDPSLTVRVVRETARYVNGQDICGPSNPIPWECSAAPQVPSTGGYSIGVDAAGNAYHLSSGSGMADFGDGRIGQILQRLNPDGSTTNLARIVRQVCNLDDCSTEWWYVVHTFLLDLTRGRILMVTEVDYCEPGWCPTYLGKLGIVEISGLPQMFDTLLTFVPGQQALGILTPGHPDGFRSADSLQVWTGNVRSMPDWSEAEPLICEAAANPVPGQHVSVADTLPDPAVGEGRYYLVASQSGPDRRLGRQYVDGAFSARNPFGLPVCQ